ncbi:MAG: hypothetical protein PF447_06920 [Spirochaetaceae bacterium]|nr:hypothetical protein [Spirochaetaceae bacterium]
MMLILIGLLLAQVLVKNRSRAVALNYHYIKALSLDPPEVVLEPQEEEMIEQTQEIPTPPEVQKEDLTPQEEEILRFITGTHKVKPGESFSLITGKYWDDIYLWPDLYVRNDMSSDDPDLIFPDEIIDIYNRLGVGDSYTEAERDEILNAYIEVYHVFKSLGDRKDSSARSLLYTATKYDENFMDIYRSEIDPDDRRAVEQYIADRGYLD